MGYEPESSLLGIEVIYMGLKNKDLDVFLGYWDPAMITYFEPYKADGSVETVVTNLEGAKYTFAVPTYAWEAGVRDFADLQKFPDQFEKKLYGIEAGSNQLMIDAMNDPALGLDGWEVVESIEQGMPAEVQRRSDDKGLIVFQGWAPHPMNTTLDIRYLTGGDKFYGPDFGAATVSTQVRAGYLEECPNVGRLLPIMTMADKIVVLNGGRIEQAGAPLELYNNPTNLFVASFIGSPEINLFEARYEGGTTVMVRGGQAMPLGTALDVPDGTGIVWVLRVFRPMWCSSSRPGTHRKCWRGSARTIFPSSSATIPC